MNAPSPKHWLLLCGRVRLSVTPWTTAHQAPLSVGFPRQALWSGSPLDRQAIPQCLCRPQDRVYMPQFAFAGPRRLGLPGLCHSDLPGLRQAPRPPPTSLPPPGCPCCAYPVCSSKCGHTSIHTPEPSLAPPPTIRPLSPLLRGVMSVFTLLCPTGPG